MVIKKLVLMLTVFFIVSTSIACSNKNNTNITISVNFEESFIEGNITEIKDFMFVLADENNEEYIFSFEKKPEDLNKVAVGEKVKVVYTGELSGIDTFIGEIISIEKIN